ncbi:MAG: HAD family hydrolase [Ruminococcaceae bacterium]|nr:HAD family hydrolase [Oscillospiraceae bacterium]
MTKTGILFDLDGTLLDTLGDLTDAVNHTLQQHGLHTWSQADIRRFVGSGARCLIERSCDGKGDVDTVLRDYKAYYDAHCQVKTAPYPHILEVLEILRRKYPIAVVSNKPDAAVKLLCAEFFPGILALGEAPDCPRKPAPDMLYKTMAQLGVDRCIYVGDSDVDVITAGNAGMPCLSVLWGFRDREEIKAAGGRYFCEDGRDLPAMIETIIGEQYGK